jgi:hypothetical protein
LVKGSDGLFMATHGAEAQRQLRLGLSGILRDLGCLLEIVDGLVIHVGVLQYAPSLIQLACRHSWCHA